MKLFNDMKDVPTVGEQNRRRMIVLLIFPIVILYAISFSFLSRIYPDSLYEIFAGLLLIFLIPIYFIGRFIKRRSNG